MGLKILVGGLIVVAPVVLFGAMRLADRSIQQVELSTLFWLNLVACTIYFGMAYYPVESVPVAAQAGAQILILSLLLTHYCSTTFPRAIGASLIYALGWMLLYAVLARVAAQVDDAQETREKIRMLAPWAMGSASDARPRLIDGEM